MSKGQVDLFTRRVRKPPPIQERPLHIAIADTLRIGCEDGWYWWHTPNGELRSHATGALLQRMGVKPGISDFLLLNPSGRLHALEIKRQGAKPNDAQLFFMALVQSRHGHAAWADSYDEAIKILREWGALKSTISPQ